MLEPPSQVEGKLRRDDTNGGHRLAPGKQFAKSVLLPLLLTASSSEWMKAGSSRLQRGAGVRRRHVTCARPSGKSGWDGSGHRGGSASWSPSDLTSKASPPIPGWCGTSMRWLRTYFQESGCYSVPGMGLALVARGGGYQPLQQPSGLEFRR